MTLLTKLVALLALVTAISASGAGTYPKGDRFCMGKCIAMGAEVGDKKCWSKQYPVDVHICMPDGCWRLVELEDECEYGCVQNANGTFARCKTEDENTGLPWE